MDQPWIKKRWLPGVLNNEQMQDLIDANIIRTDSIEKIKWDASALDLHLSSEGYEMIEGSIKPFDKSYKEIILDTTYCIELPIESDGAFLLKKNHCYVFKIKENLNPCIRNYPIYGQATAKSTVGRVDVIARLIVDGMKEYEKFDPDEVSSGEMYIEITPITFDVKVKPDISISQLRFFYGEIRNAIITDNEFIKSVLHVRDRNPNEGTLSVDLSNVELPNKTLAAAYCANKDGNKEPIELWAKEKYTPSDFWSPIPSSDLNDLKKITIEPDKFYILRSKERISLNEGVCIYCRAMDETLGEMRIHYAGFVHPCFGDERTDNKTGTPLIFEVRGHNVKILLTHEEILARLFFYRMSQHVKKPEEKVIPKKDENNYKDQELKLSTIFKKIWE
jgi:dCTP deaminase